MLDLGSSINVMPKTIYASLNLGPLKETVVIIQLTDRTNAYPDGLIEDILVQIDGLVFPIDFCVLDMDNENFVNPSPILLSWPFFSIARVRINVSKGTLTMEFGEKVVYFNNFDAMKYPFESILCLLPM